jgi:phosphohistidine phosphatase
MKQLYLLRHAHSHDKQPGQTDKLRDLSPIGASQCIAVGEFIRKQGYPIDLILSSNAQRAIATAKLVAEHIGYSLDDVLCEEDIYESSVPTLFQVIRQQEGINNILLVAHNPSISYFAEHLTVEEIGEVPPGTFMFLQSSIMQWSDMEKGNMHLMDKFVPD